jgi:hypothetical protein
MSIKNKIIILAICINTFIAATACSSNDINSSDGQSSNTSNSIASGTEVHSTNESKPEEIEELASSEERGSTLEEVDASELDTTSANKSNKQEVVYKTKDEKESTRDLLLKSCNNVKSITSLCTFNLDISLNYAAIYKDLYGMSDESIKAAGIAKNKWRDVKSNIMTEFKFKDNYIYTKQSLKGVGNVDPAGDENVNETFEEYYDLTDGIKSYKRSNPEEDWDFSDSTVQEVPSNIVTEIANMVVGMDITEVTENETAGIMQVKASVSSVDVLSSFIGEVDSEIQDAEAEVSITYNKRSEQIESLRVDLSKMLGDDTLMTMLGVSTLGDKKATDYGKISNYSLTVLLSNYNNTNVTLPTVNTKDKVICGTPEN